MGETLIIVQPHIFERSEQAYMGIRTQAPFKGMFGVVEKSF